MNESDLSKKIAKRLRDEGCWARKIAGGPSQAGLPDILACSKGVFIGIEVKLPGKERTLTTLQDHTLKEIRKAGGLGLLITSAHQVEYILRLAEFASRFNRYIIDPLTGCWIWYGSLNKGGYGEISYQKNKVKHRSNVHRIAAAIHLGLNLDDGSLCACHGPCNLPACVNPEHLWVGTQQENLDDMKQKGRQYKGDRYWLPHNQRFTNDQEDALLRAYERGIRQVDMATRFQVRPHTLWRILERARNRREI